MSDIRHSNSIGLLEPGIDRSAIVVEKDANTEGELPSSIASIRELVGKTFWEVEKDLLQATLDHHDGDKKLAANTLGISLKTLYNRLNAYSVNL